MRPEAQKYLAVETISSLIVNAILNFLPAYAIFHHRSAIPVQGSGGMFQDSIGETLIVVFLSYLVPALLGRSRRRSGKLPVSGIETRQAGNVYLQALAVAALFTVVFTAFNLIVLPKAFGSQVSLLNELAFKTVYGAVLGAAASCLSIYRTLQERALLLATR